MRRNLFYTIICILFWGSFPSALSAQNDSLPTFLPAGFCNEYISATEILSSGNLKLKVTPDPAKAFEKLSFSLFPVFDERSDSAWRFLENLSPGQKQYLLLAFSTYKPLFKTALEDAALPAELIYLPAARSFLNSRAVGANRAAGLWQLTHFQAVLNGIEANRLVDERFQVLPATQAALKQIAKNRDIFENDAQAVLGFLAGNAAVRNALRECGNDCGIQTLVEAFPEKTKNTLALWQAMAVFLSENELPAGEESLQPDTVWVKHDLHFHQLTQVLGINENQLRELNPQFRFSIVPGAGKSTALLLPAGKKDDFLLMQDSVYAAADSSLFAVVTPKIEYPPAPARTVVGGKVTNLEIEGKTKIRYTLQPGNVLGLIAEVYDVRVEDLKYWNNIINERKIQAGQKLDIFVDDDKAEYYQTLQKQEEKTTATTRMVSPAAASNYEIPTASKKIEHVVKNGESPYLIAKKYEGVSPEAILYWNGIADARKIQIGQKLTIYVVQ